MVNARVTADCQDAHFLPKTDAFLAEKEKTENNKIHFHPQTKLTERSQSPHFRRQKQKRNSVGLYHKIRIVTLIFSCPVGKCYCSDGDMA